jgi:hypothetical protein
LPPNWQEPPELWEPALDWALVPDLDTREYNGLAWYGNQLWNAYTGTWVGQPGKAVVSWNPITWPAP